MLKSGLRKTIPFIILLLLTACRQPEQLLPEEQKEIEANVRQTLENYHAAVKKEGLKGEFAYLDSSTGFFWVPPGYLSAISYDSVASVLKQNTGRYTSIHNSFENLKILPLAQNLASYTAKLHSVMTDTAGRKATYTMLETGLLIKRGNSWKLLNGQTTLLNSN